MRLFNGILTLQTASSRFVSVPLDHESKRQKVLKVILRLVWLQEFQQINEPSVETKMLCAYY